MAVSAVVTGGIGPWLPFQMLALSWMGAGAGLLGRFTRRLAPPAEVGVLAAYGWIWGFVYGAILNLWFWPFQVDGGALSYSPHLSTAETLHHYWSFYVASSFAWDAAGALANAILIVLTGRAVLPQPASVRGPARPDRRARAAPDAREPGTQRRSHHERVVGEHPHSERRRDRARRAADAQPPGASQRTLARRDARAARRAPQGRRRRGRRRRRDRGRGARVLGRSRPLGDGRAPGRLLRRAVLDLRRAHDRGARDPATGHRPGARHRHRGRMSARRGVRPRGRGVRRPTSRRRA